MHHKEECQGHLLKLGLANLEKAKGFDRNNNWMQALRFSELALTKLKLLKDRPLEAISDAFGYKALSLRFLGRYREAMESAKELYTMWAMTNIRNPRSILAAFDLIECCLQINEFVDAELFARTAYELINQGTDIIIPHHQRQEFLARGAYYLAKATYLLAKAGGIAPEAKQEAGVKAIALAREALEISTQLHGAGSVDVATGMMALADVLDHFNGVDDDEVLRLYEQAKAIFARAQGSLSPNVAVCEKNLGITYRDRAMRARAAHDLDRAVTNLQLALPHLREAVRIYRAINRVDRIDDALYRVAEVEGLLRMAEVERAAESRG